MSLTEETAKKLRTGFNHPRQFGARPKLPPGYNWKNQIQKYAPPGYFYRSYFDDPVANSIKMKQSKVAIFCHRGLYDRAMKIPENSVLAIDNGQSSRLRCHELDARMGNHSSASKSFLAHDEVAGRVTSKTRRWSSLKFSEIIETFLVTRRFNLEKQDFASTYEHTRDKVAGLESLLEYFRSTGSQLGLTLQIDLRGDDFPKAIEWFRRRMLWPSLLMLKGYNLTFASGEALRQAVEEHRVRASRSPPDKSADFSPHLPDDGKPFSWDQLVRYRVRIIMVFYSQPIINLALEKKKFKPANVSGKAP